MLNRNNRTSLQLAAILLMLIDHVGLFFFPDVVILRLIGRLCFPIYAYLVASSLKHCRSVPIYLLRLGLLGVIAQVAFFKLGCVGLNVIFLFFLASVFIQAFRKKWYAFCAIATLSAFVLPVEYGLYGFLLIIVFYYIRNRLCFFIGSLLVSSLSIIECGPMQPISFLAVFPILFLPELHFKMNRYIWRYFYPVHLYCIKALTCVFS